jgi:hypothetical protein
MQVEDLEDGVLLLVEVEHLLVLVAAVLELEQIQQQLLVQLILVVEAVVADIMDRLMVMVEQVAQV